MVLGVGSGEEGVQVKGPRYEGCKAEKCVLHVRIMSKPVWPVCGQDRGVSTGRTVVLRALRIVQRVGGMKFSREHMKSLHSGQASVQGKWSVRLTRKPKASGRC